MKSFVSIFAAAVVSSLATYLLFESLGAITTLDSNVIMSGAIFVLLMATMTAASATLSVLFTKTIVRSDDRLVAKFERRIRALEQGGKSAPPPPT